MAIPGLTARLLLDEDTDPALAHDLQGRGFDAVHVNERGRQGLSDEQQLTYAAAAGRALVTHNRDDFLHLADKWLNTNRHHAGVVYARRASIGELLRRLLNLLDRYSAEELRDLIVPLEAFEGSTG